MISRKEKDKCPVKWILRITIPLTNTVDLRCHLCMTSHATSVSLSLLFEKDTYALLYSWVSPLLMKKRQAGNYEFIDRIYIGLFGGYADQVSKEDLGGSHLHNHPPVESIFQQSCRLLLRFVSKLRTFSVLRYSHSHGEWKLYKILIASNIRPIL